MDKLPKVAVLISVGAVAAAGAVPTASAHSERCSGPFTLAYEPGNEADTNGNDFVCYNAATGVYKDDHVPKKK